MKRYLLKVIIFSLPFIAYFILIILIDPFNYFNFFHLIDNKTKHNYSYRINYAVWEALRFKENPKENVFLGDSRMAGINVSQVKQTSGLDFYDFAYGGGTLEEIINTFWYANSIVKLKNVYIGINFNLYNGFNLRDRVKGAVEMINNPFLYLSNRNTVEAAYYCLKAKLSSKNKTIEKPNISRKEFWKYKINETATRYYSKYQYPKYYYHRLKEITDYCKQNNIKLIFLILPVHVDLQKLVAKFNLKNDYKKFIRDLKNFSEVYDFNFANSLTMDESNYGDPYHLNKKILTGLIIDVLKHNYNNSFIIRYSRF